MHNKEISDILAEMAILLEMKGVEYKPRAYEKAAAGVESLAKDVTDIYESGGAKALGEEIPGVGDKIAEHIEEILQKGTFEEFEKLKKAMPVDIRNLTSVEGVGPKTVKLLWQKLKVQDLEDLEKAALAGKIRGISGLGERTEKKILRGIEFLKKSGGRKVLGFAMPDVRVLIKNVRSFPEVQKAEVAGSVRRWKETIGDIDIVAASEEPEKVMQRFTKLGLIEHVYALGDTKALVRLKNGLDADLRVVPEQSFGAALHYLTGSREHNVKLRELALKKGLKINEYGVFKGTKRIAGKTEQDIYKALGLAYIEPEMRENWGEIQLSLKNKLPDLISYNDLKGDLQTQTDWTDGEASIEDMARAAEKAGLEYIAITDHTKSLAMTGGSDEKRLQEQMAEIDRINKKLQDTRSKIQVLKGAEVNILRDGSLDISNEVLAQLDIVGAAVHSHFKLSEEEQTTRVVRAMENPHVDIIFHLSARIINSREPIELDMENIFETAKRTRTVLEIDAYPVRLDIRDAYIKRCVQEGILMAIDSDAHAPKHFQFLEFGIAQARRGWVAQENVLNTRSLEELIKFLKTPKSQRNIEGLV